VEIFDNDDYVADQGPSPGAMVGRHQPQVGRLLRDANHLGSVDLHAAFVELEPGAGVAARARCRSAENGGELGHAQGLGGCADQPDPAVDPRPSLRPGLRDEGRAGEHGVCLDRTRHWRNLAAAGRPGWARIFDSHFMPVTNVFTQFPIPPNVEKYRREGGVFNGTIFRVGHFFALAMQHDWPVLQARPEPGSVANNAFLQIWPTGPDVRWPPTRPVDDLGDPHQVTRFLEIGPPLVLYGP
jgi:hypothetical protein